MTPSLELHLDIRILILVEKIDVNASYSGTVCSCLL